MLHGNQTSKPPLPSHHVPVDDACLEVSLEGPGASPCPAAEELVLDVAEQTKDRQDFVPIAAAALIAVPAGIVAKLLHLTIRIAGTLIGIVFTIVLVIMLIAQGSISFWSPMHPIRCGRGAAPRSIPLAGPSGSCCPGCSVPVPR